MTIITWGVPFWSSTATAHMTATFTCSADYKIEPAQSVHSSMQVRIRRFELNARAWPRPSTPSIRTLGPLAQHDRDQAAMVGAAYMLWMLVLEVASGTRHIRQ